jgi:hypothetical protein
MKGLIKENLVEGIKKGKSLNIIQRFLSIRYRIKVSLNVLRKRKTNLK